MRRRGAAPPSQRSPVGLADRTGAVSVVTASVSTMLRCRTPGTGPRRTRASSNSIGLPGFAGATTSVAESSELTSPAGEMERARSNGRCILQGVYQAPKVPHWVTPMSLSMRTMR